MKFLIVLCLSMCVVIMAAPQGARNDQATTVVRYVNNPWDDNTGYQFTYELSDNQIHSQAGALKQVGEDRVVIVQGAYSFVGPDGLIYWVNYTADENGFHPVVGTGPEGGIKGGQDQQIDPNVLKSLVG